MSVTYPLYSRHSPLPLPEEPDHPAAPIKDLVKSIEWEAILHHEYLGGSSFRMLGSRYTHYEVPTAFPKTIQNNDGAGNSSDKAEFWDALPDELQLMVIQNCDQATLFRLMQACPQYRTEAQKMVINAPDVWYHVKGEWLFEENHRCMLMYNPSFLGQIERVEIEYDVGQMRDELPDLTEEDLEQDQAPSARIVATSRKFWQKLKHFFSSATQVVLSETYVQSAGGIAVYPNLDCLTALADSCPDGIELHFSHLEDPLDKVEAGPDDCPVCILLEDPDFSFERKLWKSVKADRILWKLESPKWSRRQIRPPLRRTPGLAGMIESFIHYMSLRENYMHAEDYFQLQATEAINAWCTANGGYVPHSMDCSEEHTIHRAVAAEMYRKPREMTSRMDDIAEQFARLYLHSLPRNIGELEDFNSNDPYNNTDRPYDRTPWPRALAYLTQYAYAHILDKDEALSDSISLRSGDALLKAVGIWTEDEFYDEEFPEDLMVGLFSRRSSSATISSHNGTAFEAAWI